MPRAELMVSWGRDVTGCTQPSHGGAYAAALLSLQLTFHPSKHDVINNMEALSLAVLIVSFQIGRNSPHTNLPLCAGAAAGGFRRASRLIAAQSGA